MEEDRIARNVKVVPYDPRWPEIFRAESIQIEQALGNNCSAIHHIGSTAIPGLSAKPIIDILPVVKDIVEVDAATKAMEGLGYEAKGENGMAFRRFFQKGKEVRTHHVHVYEKEDPISPSHLISYFNEEKITTIISEAVSMIEATVDKKRVLSDCIKRMKEDKLKASLLAVQFEIKEAETLRDTSRVDKLIAEYNKLIKGVSK